MRSIVRARLVAPVTFFISLAALAVSAQQTGAPPAYRGNTRAYLGVYLGDAPATKGAVVGKVVEDSPAAKAGLRVNDVILSFDQTLIENAAHVHRLLGELPPGSALTVGILRGETTRTLPVTLGERVGLVDACQRLFAQAALVQAEANRLRQLADEARQKGNEDEAKKRLEESTAFAKQAALLREDVEKALNEGASGAIAACRKARQPARPPLGLNALPLSEQLAQYFNVKTGAGLLLTEVKPDSLAARQGLRAGDCLLSINGKAVATLAEVQRLLNQEDDAGTRAANASPVEYSLLIVRDGAEETLQFKL